MKTKQKIGFGIYLLVGIMGILWGLLYFFSSEMMPYHAQAIGKSWVDMEKGIQVIILALMEAMGGALFCLGLVSLIILFIPFRRQETWANWALFVSGVLVQISFLFVTLKVHILTQASTPWYVSLMGIVAVMMAFLLSWTKGKA